jgi:hypothetical protein
MATNYNSSSVGVPYVRANNINIQYDATGIPTVVISQATAIKLADGTVAEIQQIHSFAVTLDMVNNLTTPIALVDPTTGANLGANTNLEQVMLGILAVVRQQQLLNNP